MLFRTLGPSVLLCGLVQFRYMAEQNWISFRYMPILRVHREDLDWAEAVAFVRGDGLLDEWMAKICKQRGKRILYILDDDLLQVPLTLGSGCYYAQRSVQKHIRQILEYSNCFLSPSTKLLEIYGAGKEAAIRISEPAIHVSAQRAASPDGRVRIGFAGSPDRSYDIDLLLTDALMQLKEKYGDGISIEFFGSETEIAKTLKCTTYPYTDSYETYRKQMEALCWDIGLAPMPDTHFHSCKHYNKLVEYCSYGIVGVYSRVLPYTAGVDDGVNGLLCGNTTAEWVEALSKLIEDTEFRLRLSQNCLRCAREQFSVARSAEDLYRHLSSLPDITGTGKGPYFLGIAKFLGMCSWFLEKFQKYGWRTPAVAWEKAGRMFRKRKKM